MDEPTVGSASVDDVALRTFLDAHVPGGVPAELTVQLLSRGRSNPTFTVTDGEHDWILRRPPFGQVLETAHDMAREYRVMSALQTTAVPVPRTIVYCGDESVIGAEFYIMDRLDGMTFRNDQESAILTLPQQAALSESMLRTFVDLHEVDVASVGLADFGRPSGFLERQVVRWRKQWDAAHLVERPEVDLLLDRLGRSVPETLYPGIIHGDYKLDNLMLDRDEPSRILGVLDWEMSTYGDTLADLGVFVSLYDEVGRPFNPVSAGTTAHPGFLSRAEAIDRYATLRGIDLPTLDWYVVLAYLKVAIIVEQIHTRHVKGLTVGDGFDDAGDMVQPLLTNAMEWASASSIPELRI